MPELTGFLLARIAEDERTARGCAGGAGNGHDPSWCMVHGDVWGHGETPETRRVLVECEAKHRIVEMHTGSHECPSKDANCGFWTPGTVDFDGEACPDCPTLRLLALPYADHPDYREEWRP